MTAARFVRFGVLRPVAQGLASSAAATVQAVPFIARPDVGAATTRLAAWLPRVRSLARTPFER